MNLVAAQSASSNAHTDVDDLISVALNQTSVKVDGCFCEIKNELNDELIDLNEVQALRCLKDNDIEVILRGGSSIKLMYASDELHTRDLAALKTAWVAFKKLQVKFETVCLGDEIHRVEDIKSAVAGEFEIKLVKGDDTHDIIYTSERQLRRDFDALQKAMGVINPQ
jgi:hypothetical protein